jgi:hypothetical protein
MQPNRLTELPTPKWKVGDTVFTVETRDGQETAQCPDCLGTKVWAVRSPGGFETTVECPRCSGTGKLGLRSRMALVRQLTVGSLRVSTVAYHGDEHIEYMCDETGVGSGSIWRESRLRATREEAAAAAELEAAKERADLDRGLPGEERRQIRYLNKYTMMTAEAKAADRRAWSAEYDYRRLIENIAKLEHGTFLSSYGFEEDEEKAGRPWGASLDLEPGVVRLLQEHLCSFAGENAVAALREARANLEKECKC